MLKLNDAVSVYRFYDREMDSSCKAIGPVREAVVYGQLRSKIGENKICRLFSKKSKRNLDFAVHVYNV